MPRTRPGVSNHYDTPVLQLPAQQQQQEKQQEKQPQPQQQQQQQQPRLMTRPADNQGGVTGVTSYRIGEDVRAELEEEEAGTRTEADARSRSDPEINVPAAAAAAAAAAATMPSGLQGWCATLPRDTPIKQ
jgi:membrane protein involved in colicin uptake